MLQVIEFFKWPGTTQGNEVFRNFPFALLGWIAEIRAFYWRARTISYAIAFSGITLFLGNPALSKSQDSGIKIGSNAVAATPTPIPRPPIDQPTANPSELNTGTASTEPLARSVHLVPSTNVPAPAELEPKTKASESATPVKIEQRFGLPPASRQRVHECAVEWQKMKLEGASNDKTWRDFAQTCLVK